MGDQSPRQVLRLDFGIGVFLGLLLGGNEGFLESLCQAFDIHSTTKNIVILGSWHLLDVACTAAYTDHMEGEVNVRVVQHRPALGDLAANIDEHREMIVEAAGDAVDVIVFSELSLTGYALRDLVAAVALDSAHPLWPVVCELSESIDVVLGYVERGNRGEIYNATGYFHAGELLHRRRKVHLPTYGPFQEGRFFAAGFALDSFDAPWGRAALAVCEEIWHPGTIAALARNGVAMIFATANAPGRIPVDGGWESHRAWRRLVAAYARRHAAWVPFASRIGYEEGFIFGGGSAVFAPDGSMAGEAGFLEPAQITAQCAPQSVVAARELRDSDLRSYTAEIDAALDWAEAVTSGSNRA